MTLSCIFFLSLQLGGKFLALYLDLTQFLTCMSTLFLKKYSEITQGNECLQHA